MAKVAVDAEAIEDLDELTTIVLVGSTGTGKSATGNSILGRPAFKSAGGTMAVTNACERKYLTLSDDKILFVIDTLGLFDSSSKPGEIQKEIARCMDYAKEGIHAIILVVPLKRYTNEQVEVVISLKRLFGPKIVDYMIIAFTYGDKMMDNTLGEIISVNRPLKELLGMCGNRCVVFKNKAKEAEATKQKQRNELLKLIGETVKRNGKKPYTENLTPDVQGAREEYEATIEKLKQDLEKLKIDVAAQGKLNQNSHEEIKYLTEQLKNAQAASDQKWSCAVM